MRSSRHNLPPLSIATHSSRTATSTSMGSPTTTASPGSVDNEPSYASLDFNPFGASRRRQDSHGSSRSASSRGSRSHMSSPTKNVYTHCGRHTNQFLFGGRSMTDMFRAIMARRD